MALCLPRKRSATSLATRPSTLSVASITNHSCFTSAGLALTVVVIRLSSTVWRVLFLGRCPSGGDLLGGVYCFAAGPMERCEPGIIAGRAGVRARPPPGHLPWPEVL